MVGGALVAAVSTIIPGMRKLKYVQANCAASDGKLLTHQELKSLSEHAFVHGWKYPCGVKRKSNKVIFLSEYN